MRKIKKMLSLVLVVTMAMSFAACGSKDDKKSNSSEKADITVEELVNKMADASKDSKSVEVNGKIDVDASLSIDGQNADIKMSGSVDSKANTSDENSIVYAKANVSYDISGMSQENSFEEYMSTDTESVKTYISTDGGDWEYSEQDLADSSESITDLQEQLKNIDFSKIEKYCESMNVNADGSDYELVCKISSDTFKDLVEENNLSEGTLGQYISIIPEFDITLTSSVDGSTFLPKTLSLKVNTDKIEIETYTVEIKNFSFEMNFDSYNDVEVTIPDEVLDAEN